MFGSVIVEMALGMTLLYLLLSLICSALNEIAADLFDLRATNLRAGIRNMLADPDAQGLAAKVYDHPLIRGLTRAAATGTPPPSYIPSRIFASALVDVVANLDPTKPATDLAGLRAAAAGITNPETKQVIVSLIDGAEKDLKSMRDVAATWFDDAMGGVSGWYRHRVHLILLGLGLLVSAGLNVDTFAIGDRLLRDASLRAALVSSAEQISQEMPDRGATPTARLAELAGRLDELHLPLGWSNGPDGGGIPSGFRGWIEKLGGLLATTVALSMGAPFWFGMLNRVVNVRSGAAPPKRAGEG